MDLTTGIKQLKEQFSFEEEQRRAKSESRLAVLSKESEEWERQLKSFNLSKDAMEVLVGKLRRKANSDLQNERRVYGKEHAAQKDRCTDLLSRLKFWIELLVRHAP